MLNAKIGCILLSAWLESQTSAASLQRERRIGFRVAWQSLACAVLLTCTGCGMFGGAAQLKQLQAENDKLVSEYRAMRDKVAKLQEANLAYEQRVAEAEKLLARSGYSSPSSRLSQVPNRPTMGDNSGAPPYVPPPSGTDADLKWRPMRRQ